MSIASTSFKKIDAVQWDKRDSTSAPSRSLPTPGRQGAGHPGCGLSGDTEAPRSAINLIILPLMAQTIEVKLVDDIDGGNADETVAFGLDGKSYEIELSKKNASALRKALSPYVDSGRPAGRVPAPGRARSSRRGSGAGSRTLFSALSAEEKAAFRAWANMPTARRVSDTRVQGWNEVGRP